MLYLDFPTSLFSLSQTISDTWGQEPGSLTHRHRRLLTQKRIFRPAYYFTVGTNNAVKCYVISAVIWLHYLQSSVFISISQTQMKLEPPPPQVEFTKEALSISEYVLGKSWPHRAVSNYLCLLGAWSYANVVLFMFFFKTIRAMDQKPNWNVRLALEKIYHWYFII